MCLKENLLRMMTEIQIFNITESSKTNHFGHDAQFQLAEIIYKYFQ